MGFLVRENKHCVTLRQSALLHSIACLFVSGLVMPLEGGLASQEDIMENRYYLKGEKHRLHVLYFPVHSYLQFQKLFLDAQPFPLGSCS